LLILFSPTSFSALLLATGSYEVSNSLARSFAFSTWGALEIISFLSETVLYAILDADSSYFKIGLISSFYF